MRLGAGRATTADEIDHAVGIVCLRKRGDRVEAGEPLAEIHAQDERQADAIAPEVTAAFQLGDEEPPRTGVILETLT
jgi:thymidine phosphorylase